MGNEISKADAEKDCDPIVTNADAGKTVAIDDDFTVLEPSDVAIPCGLIAKSFFTDKYEMLDSSDNDVEID